MTLSAILALSFVFAAIDDATNDAQSDPIALEAWLTAGPEPIHLPLFGDADKNGVDLAKVLVEENAFHGTTPPILDGTLRSSLSTMRWTESSRLLFPSQPYPQRALAVTRITLPRFTSCELSLRTSHLLRVLVDGEEKAKKGETDAPGAEPPKPITAKLKLESGTHTIELVSIYSETGSDDWTIDGELKVDGSVDGIRVSTSPTRPVSIDDILDADTPASVSLSSDGRYAAIFHRRPEVPASHSESWLEIVDADHGKVIQTTIGIGSPSGFGWHPTRPAYYYTRVHDSKSTLYLADVGGDARPILRDVERLESVAISPDGESILYSCGEESEKNSSGLKRLRGPTDRWGWGRNVSHLYQAPLDGSGVRRRLTAGPRSAVLQDISPKGTHLLFTRTDYDSTTRPFSTTELWELDLRDLQSRIIATSAALRGASYSPDGTEFLISGGLTFLHERSLDNESPPIPNDYDIQLYLLNRKSLALTFLTEKFDPAIQGAAWSSQDGRIYVSAEEGLRVKIFAIDPVSLATQEIPSGCDAVSQFDLARNALRIACIGSGAVTPPRVIRVDVGSTVAHHVLTVPGEESWLDRQFGSVRPFDVEHDGTTLLGRIHFPPNFDPRKKYPAIVYYYGGTSPTSMSFGGRYPLVLWAAHGYIVYNVIPSGSTGQGGEFARRHVNDWGVRAGAEILAAVDQLVEEHPYVDNDRIGCIGASYGGFMTMHLVTQTDRFAAAISHAGISSLSSYWGEGYWGYLYSAVATADRYPWNDSDLYVGQSPLFHADKIHTPLLLLHGTSDTNVPIGESEQLYTALKILGRNVEFIEVDGEDHHILDYPKRKLWMKTILAWFDKNLKGDPAWWNELWP